MATRPGPVRLALLAALDLVLPHRCGGCREAPAPGRPLCEACERRLAALVHPPRQVAPRPRPPGLPPVHATAPYADVVAGLLRAWKDEDRRDLTPLLAGLLTPALRAACPPGALVVPVPTSPAARRRRGDAPLLLLLERAGPGLGVVPADALRVARRVADQATLDRAGRAANLDHAFVARAGAHLDGRPVVLVDDVLTTGATLAEAARAVRTAGGRPVAAAVLAATRRRAAGTRRASGSLSG